MRTLIEKERKGCESIIHDRDCDLWVTMVGWVDVPYSDWGDFRRWHTVDIYIRTPEANFIEIFMDFKIASANWPPCCPGLNVLTVCDMWTALLISFITKHTRKSLSSLKYYPCLVTAL